MREDKTKQRMVQKHTIESNLPGLLILAEAGVISVCVPAFYTPSELYHSLLSVNTFRAQHKEKTDLSLRYRLYQRTIYGLKKETTTRLSRVQRCSSLKISLGFGDFTYAGAHVHCAMYHMYDMTMPSSSHYIIACSRSRSSC